MMNDCETHNDMLLTIYIDVEDKSEIINNQSFYFHPNRLSSISLLSQNMFECLKIKNCETEKLSYMILLYMYKALQPLANCEIIIYNPNISQIEHDCKIFENNAKLAGFTNFEYESGAFYHPVTKEYKSNKIMFDKPSKVVRKKIEKKTVKFNVNKKLADIQNSLANLKEEIGISNKIQRDSICNSVNEDLEKNLKFTEGKHL